MIGKDPHNAVSAVHDFFDYVAGDGLTWEDGGERIYGGTVGDVDAVACPDPKKAVVIPAER